jgi:phosphoribosylglycinamide formyltransferase-1
MTAPASARTPTRIGVLASGGGSNMQAILEAITAGTIAGTLVRVVSDTPQAFALERARLAGIPTSVIGPHEHRSRAAFSQAIAALMKNEAIDLIVMAGFMRVVTAELITPFLGRILNIHPSLIPSFCGPGFYGHHVHEAVLRSGVKVSGCTVHFVEEAVDAGPIVIQRVVPVVAGDTPDILAARILIEEHQAYPEAVRLFCAGRLQIDNRLVRILPATESA